MKKLFEISVGFNGAEYFSRVYSMTDNKIAPLKARSLRVLMSGINKLVREKAKEVKNFPIPEPSRIINIQDAAPSIITGVNGRC